MQNIANEEMAAAWNGVSGRAWVDEQQLLDRAYAPIEKLSGDEVAAIGARSVLDIGCGSGATTLAVSRNLGSLGRARVSTSPSRDLRGACARTARSRRRNSSARTPDARLRSGKLRPHDFPIWRNVLRRSGGRFANLRTAAPQSGQLRLVVFRAIAENPFMTTAERAAAPLLTNLPPRKPNAPGQFAFAVSRTCGASSRGVAPRRVRARRYRMRISGRGPGAFLHAAGPLGQVLRDADEAMRRRVIDEVRAAFESFVRGSEVRFTAACWMISAANQRNAAHYSPCRPP